MEAEKRRLSLPVRQGLDRNKGQMGVDDNELGKDGSSGDVKHVLKAQLPRLIGKHFII